VPESIVAATTTAAARPQKGGLTLPVPPPGHGRTRLRHAPVEEFDQVALNLFHFVGVEAQFQQGVGQAGRSGAFGSSGLFFMHAQKG
jgi:hypothetical protein